MSNQLLQGISLLQIRKKRANSLLGQMNIIDDRNNPLRNISHYANDCKPRYASKNKIIETFTDGISAWQWKRNQGNINADCPSDGKLSWCHTDDDECPNYGYCPGLSDNLLWEKDDDPSQQATQMSQLNQLQSRSQSMYKNYMERLHDYIKNPPVGLEGKNVILGQLEGGPE